MPALSLETTQGPRGHWTLLETRLRQSHWLPGIAIPTGRAPSSCSAPPSLVGDQAWSGHGIAGANAATGEGGSRDSCDCRSWGAAGKEPAAGTLHTLTGARLTA